MEPKIIDLTRYVDDRGDLCELWRFSWEIGEKLPFQEAVDVCQVYTVFDPTPNTIRAYHRHQYLWDLFHIASGSAKFHVIRGPDVFPAKDREMWHGEGDGIYTLSARKPQLLVVPPLYWHGWMSLEPDTLLVSLASHEYNRENPDEERIPFDTLDPDIWRVEYK